MSIARHVACRHGVFKAPRHALRCVDRPAPAEGWQPSHMSLIVMLMVW
jgi:hypothetical protein